MNRYTFLLKSEELNSITGVLSPVRKRFRRFTMWKICDYIFAYFEGSTQDKECMLAELDKLPEQVECLCLPGQMTVMYENLGFVSDREEGLSYRVFASRLKPGCAEEYRRRHAQIPPLPTDRESCERNWGIWLGDGCIFGYCELNMSLWKEPTEEDLRETVEWETRQLEIMDWLTDDIDWLTGEHHTAAQRIL